MVSIIVDGIGKMIPSKTSWNQGLNVDNVSCVFHISLQCLQSKVIILEQTTRFKQKTAVLIALNIGKRSLNDNSSCCHKGN